MEATAADHKALRRLTKFTPYIKRIVTEELALQAPRQVEITMGETVTKIDDHTHELFETVLKAVMCGPVALIGPAGSGKTTMAEQVAKALGRKFYFTGAITSEYKLMGFVDANGRLVRTAFREAYEHGGLFLFDELDASLPPAILAFNNALANGSCDFPDKNVEKHPDFLVMAAANTYGHGADRVYVGRNQLDAASLDRFIFITMNYDEVLECKIGGDADWIEHIQLCREAVRQLKLRYIVSPRASIYGSRLLAQGMEMPTVEQMVLYKGMPAEEIKMVREKMRMIATQGIEEKPQTVAA